jgi:hypothetical protein
MSYITFNLGQCGQLGSQIQQYTSLYCVAKENNKKLIFPESYRYAGFHIKISSILDIELEYVEDSFFDDFINIKIDTLKIVDENLLNLDPNKNYYIDQLFNLPHWWYPKYKEEVLNWKWNKQVLEKANKQYQDIKVEEKESVAIHARKGDYLWPHHYQTFCDLKLDYYKFAIDNYFSNKNKYHFYIFSNDIDWCKNTFANIDNLTFLEEGNQYNDLVLISLCDHNIIANSSYSIWAAWRNFNKNKIIVCPKNYVRTNTIYEFILNGNYYPEEWIAIENNNL